MWALAFLRAWRKHAISVRLCRNSLILLFAELFFQSLQWALMSCVHMPEGLFWGAQGLLCLARVKRLHCCFMLVRVYTCVGIQERETWSRPGTGWQGIWCSLAEKCTQVFFMEGVIRFRSWRADWLKDCKTKGTSSDAFRTQNTEYTFVIESPGERIPSTG